MAYWEELVVCRGKGIGSRDIGHVKGGVSWEDPALLATLALCVNRSGLPTKGWSGCVGNTFSPNTLYILLFLS